MPPSFSSSDHDDDDLADEDAADLVDDSLLVDDPALDGTSLEGASLDETTLNNDVLTETVGITGELTVGQTPAALIPRSAVPADSERPGRVMVDDFRVLGLADRETRLNVIRQAADAAIHKALSESTVSGEDGVVRVAAATYRLLDPRYRDAEFHRIRVGRLMPLALARASYTRFAQSVPGPSTIKQKKQKKNPKLFGKVMPIGTTGIKQRRLDRHLKSSAGQLASDQTPATSPRASDFDTEANQVLAELLSVGWRRRVPAFLLTGRGLSLVAVGALVPMLLLSLFARGPAESSATVADHPTTADIHGPAPPKTETLPIESIPQPKQPDKEVTRASTSNDSSQDNANNSKVTTTDLSDIDQFMADLETHRVMPKSADPSPLKTDELTPQAKPMPGKSDSENSATTDVNATESMDDPAQPDKSPNPSDQKSEQAGNRRFTQSEVEQAIKQLWEETETRYSQFTSSRVVELMDRWDLLGQVAGPGSLENAAAMHLNLQAAWLVTPMPRLVEQIRETNELVNGKAAHAGDALSEQEMNLCLISWRQCREKISRSEDLNQMLAQGNALMDYALVNEVISESTRQALLSSVQMDLARLARIVADERVVKETSHLIEAIESLPAPTDLDRMELADKPSGLLARVRCLKQRRWSTHLSALAHASDPALASCAKAELEWLKLKQSDDSLTEQSIAERNAELAERWTKVANRYGAVEAGNIYLHAIDLIGDASENQSQRESLIADLPSYLVP